MKHFNLWTESKRNWVISAGHSGSKQVIQGQKVILVKSSLYLIIVLISWLYETFQFMNWIKTELGHFSRSFRVKSWCFNRVKSSSTDITVSLSWYLDCMKHFNLWTESKRNWVISAVFIQGHKAGHPGSNHHCVIVLISWLYETFQFMNWIKTELGHFSRSFRVKSRVKSLYLIIVLISWLYETFQFMNWIKTELGHFSRSFRVKAGHSGSNHHCTLSLSWYLDCMKHFNLWTDNQNGQVPYHFMVKSGHSGSKQVIQGQIITVPYHCLDILTVWNISIYELNQNGTGSFQQVIQGQSRSFRVKSSLYLIIVLISWLYETFQFMNWIKTELGHFSRSFRVKAGHPGTVNHFNLWTDSKWNSFNFMQVINSGSKSGSNRSFRVKSSYLIIVLISWLYETFQFMNWIKTELGHFSRSFRVKAVPYHCLDILTVWNISIYELNQNGTGSFQQVIQGQIITVPYHCLDILTVWNISIYELNQNGTGSFQQVIQGQSRSFRVKASSGSNHHYHYLIIVLISWLYETSSGSIYELNQNETFQFMNWVISAGHSGSKQVIQGQIITVPYPGSNHHCTWYLDCMKHFNLWTESKRNWVISAGHSGSKQVIYQKVIPGSNHQFYPT